MTTRGFARLITLEALLLLPLARLLVDHIPMKHWRHSLGTLVKSGRPTSARDLSQHAGYDGFLWLARRVERAAARLPIHTKCLPRAIALQWMLRRRSMDARLVVAIYKGPDRSIDEYHAWVEAGGEIILGHCDRQLYRPLMVFDNSSACSRSGAQG